MKSSCRLFKRTGLGAVLVCGLLLAQPELVHAQHVHVNAGAMSISQDSPLYFVNGDIYDTDAKYDVYLSFTNAGSFSNLYQGAGVTFTALASTLDNGGPAFGHAAEGAFLQLQFVSASGPPGGVFGVWMEDAGSPGGNGLLFALPVGASDGTNLIALSESEGSPGADPYGHIHGRTFTATKPGLYRLGCRILDTSSNGVDGNPIHTPSAVYFFYFQAGLTISSWARDANSFAVTFGTTVGKTYYIESSPDLLGTNWTTRAGPFDGNNYLQTGSAIFPESRLFFRLRAD